LTYFTSSLSPFLLILSLFDPMARYETQQEPRNRSGSLSAAWSFLWRGSKQHHVNQHHSVVGGTSRSTKHLSIKEEEDYDDDEDKALGKGVTRKSLYELKYIIIKDRIHQDIVNSTATGATTATATTTTATVGATSFTPFASGEDCNP
ncbi:hypothetical protein BGZ65_003899, partial [Modicella reniformis]